MIFKNNKGITLIALVVTIVVLIILAGVSISMLTGENGIVTQAQNAKEETEIGKEKEMVTLAVSSLKAQGYETGENMLTSENLQKEMDELAGKDKTLVTGDTILTVLFKDSNREYNVNSDGEFVEPIDYENIYTYTETGFITGLKSEYIYEKPSDRYATKNEIKLAERYSYLIDELNGTLEIPNNINGTDIIGIATRAFYNISNLEQVIIEKGINIIGEEVFYMCETLESITFPETLISIGYHAFYSCIGLTNITIPFSVMEIDTYAFFGCDNLTSIAVEQEEGTLAGEPWGADNAIVTYVGGDVIEEFVNNYLSDKTEQELEEIILKDEKYIGTFEEYLSGQGKTRDDLKQKASNNSMTYMEYLKSIIIQKGQWIGIEYYSSIFGILNKSVDELEASYVKVVKIMEQTTGGGTNRRI